MAIPISLEEIKDIGIKELIEKETHLVFRKNQLEKCPLCGSGTGKNKSSAFHINPDGNFFNCFACSVGGSTIDFISKLKKIEPKEAISYLKKEYLNSDNNFQTNGDNLTSLEKRIWAIKHNDKVEAVKYLEGRGVKASILPKDSFFYDKLSHSVVFLDSAQNVINERFIPPLKNDQKYRFTGTLKNSFYNKCFKNEQNKVFLVEGVINALSLGDKSSLAMLSSSNKIDHPEILRKYLSKKSVILAFDNDPAGRKCTKYYTNFIIQNFNVKSLSQLKLPEGEDINSFLVNGVLREYLSKAKNYETIYEDILTKALPIKSKNAEEDLKRHQFFIKDGAYYTLQTGNGHRSEKQLSNFTMEVLFHLVDGSNDTKRIIKFQRNTGEIVIKELLSSEIALDKFKRTIRSISGRGLSFFGQTINLEHIFAYLQDQEIVAQEITTLGYQPESELYCFANSVITKNGQRINLDKTGIAKINGAYIYLPPYAYTNLENKEYENDRKFVFQEGTLKSHVFSDLVYRAYGVNGIIGILFTASALFRDLILEHLGFFPFLFLFGDQGAGKSSFVNIFLSLFGKSTNGHSLLNSTSKGLSRVVSQKRNALVYLKEYSNVVDKSKVDFFKTGYDGDLYSMAQKTTDNKTNSLEILSGCMIDGNELPTNEAALYARMIILNFELSQFTEDSTKAYLALKDGMEEGLGQIIKVIIMQRDLFLDNYKNAFQHIFYSLKNDTDSVRGMDDRQLRHMALLLTTYELLMSVLGLPLTLEEIKKEITANFIEQDEILNEVKDISIFWSAIAHKRASCFKEALEGEIYIKDEIKGILYLKFNEVYPYYTEYVKKNNMQLKDKSTLRSFLTSSGNPSFIPGHQKSRAGSAYTHSKLGSCYQFKYANGEYGIIINGQEYKL